MTQPRGLAVVTGASSGIGAACVRRLRTEGFDVIAAARRVDRLAELAEQTGARAVACDVTSDADVARLAEAVGDEATLLVNNAGGAMGLDFVEAGRVDDWQWMYDVNVLGSLRVTKAILPALEASGAGTIV